MLKHCLVGVCLTAIGHTMLNSSSFDGTDDGMSGWSVMYNHFKNVTQVQNAYSSRDITFMHNTIEHVLSNEALNGQPRLARLSSVEFTTSVVFHTHVHAFMSDVPSSDAFVWRAIVLQRISFARSTSTLCHKRAKNSESFFSEFRAHQLFLSRTACLSLVD